MSPEDHCPQLEQIAALADGQLRGEERSTVLHHVNDCEHCFFVYHQTLEELDTNALEKRAGSSSFKSVALGAGLAAVVLIGIGISWVVHTNKAWRATDWWQARYGVAAPSDPARKHAEAVFQRVVAAVPGVQNATLIFIEEEAQEIALAIPDAIVLSRKAYDLCVEGVTKIDGDARLALVFGHELAHLREGEFLHGFAAFDTLPNFLSPEVSKATSVKTEKSADQWGFLFAAQAGFKPQTISRQSEPFFKAWSQRLGGDLEHYPTVDQRVENLAVRLEEAATAYDYFAWGVRFYQIGDFDRAQAFFETYQQAFAGREVHNNLGLVALQQALKRLAACDGDDVIRFRLPLMVDPQTIIEGARFRGDNQKASCLENQEVREGFELAVDHFVKAMQQDPDYLPAKINRASTYILANQSELALIFSNAMGSSPQAEVLKALALYIFGAEKDNASDIDEALMRLIDMASSDPSAAYNAASISQLLGREANALWALFLSQEEGGPYAAVAREALGLQAVAPSPVPLALPALPLGWISDETEALLDTMASRPLSTQDGQHFTTYHHQNSRILVKENSILMVEQSIDPSVRLESVFPEGTGGRAMLHGRGMSILGRGWIIDAEAGQLVRKLAYNPE